MNIRSAVVTMLALSLAAGPALAAGKSKNKGGGNKPAITVEGRVQATNPKKNLMTMKTSAGDTLVIKLDRQTKVIRGSKETLDILNLKNGKKIRVRYDDKGSVNLARWVLILPDQGGDKKGAKKGKKAAEETEQQEEEKPAE